MFERYAEVVVERQEVPEASDRAVSATAEPVVQALIAEHCHASCSLTAIDQRTWAILGSIAYDGEVILAEFETREDAEIALEQFSTPEDLTPTR